MLFWLAIGMTILGNTIYILCTKLTAPVNPLVALAVSYAVALVSSLVLFPFFSQGSTFMTELRGVNGVSVALGLSLVLLESGFILAYRAGWHLSYAALFSNVAVAILLIPISWIAFASPLTWSKGAGMVLATLGLILMAL